MLAWTLALEFYSIDVKETHYNVKMSQTLLVLP